MKALLLATAALAIVCLPLALLPSCATDTGNVSKDRAGRVTNAVLESGAQFVGRVALATLQNAAQGAFDGGKVDLAHSAAEGLWAQAPSIVSSADVQRVVNAWSGNQLDTVAAAAAAAYRQANPQTPAERAKVVDALAGSVSQAAFDASGQP